VINFEEMHPSGEASTPNLCSPLNASIKVETENNNNQVKVKAAIPIFTKF
jgi:hypothetical protein